MKKLENKVIYINQLACNFINLHYKDANGKTCHQKIGRTDDLDLDAARSKARKLKAEILHGDGRLSWREARQLSLAKQRPVPYRLQVQAVEELGILPDRARWCTATQLNGVLVAPDRRRWALIPYEDPQTMAYNVQAIIQFVE